jgi:hypothetical protein
MNLSINTVPVWSNYKYEPLEPFAAVSYAFAFASASPSERSLISGPDYTIHLFEDGCIASSGNPNCTLFCGDSSKLFSGMQTLWNCLTLTAIVLNIQDFNLSASNMLALDSSAQRMGVGNITQFNASGVLNDYVQCAVGTCHSGFFWNCSQYLNLPVGPMDVDPVSTEIGLSTICDNFLPDANPDIAGPGVSDGACIGVCKKSKSENQI